ncbi:calcitonin gene-related peptide type 1 receptor-like [Saccostrea echinata]|uniref:calcitonin gene-related peptide type 1 receptor-like n=1 Tax=Saccostrea echinata TaxID=191078 RepID=UPI002A80F9AE|nr:calcitonin gene-related peptide type 1 receptor-like [Saccostrea echinata]
MLPLSVCLHSEGVYNIVTALFCYRILVPHFSNDSKISWEADFQNGNYRFISTSENDAFSQGYSFVPDINNETNSEIACIGLTKADCQRWISCSRTARNCCERHKATNASRFTLESHCEATWDGVSCFDSTLNGTVVDTECPSFYIPTEGSVTASKTCLSSGKWHTPEAGLFVDGIIHTYFVCKQRGTREIVGAELIETQRLVTLITNSISLPVLVLSLVVLACFKSQGNTASVDKSRRVFQIHGHFLSSLILVGVLSLIWDEVFVRNHIEKIHDKTSWIALNLASCKLINCLQKYFRSTTYFWMFVEGLNVLIPLYQTFNREMGMPLMCFLGWGFPLITVAVYAILRSTIERYNFKCWIYTFLEIEWIIWGPNYLTILCNLIFLIVIVRAIVKKNKEKKQHRSPSMIPKPLRSLMFLIPLFGINFIFVWVTYATNSDWPFILGRFVEGIEGVFVCILWVACSKQVQKNVTRTTQRKFPNLFVRFKGRKFSTSSCTHLTQAIHPINTMPNIYIHNKFQDISTVPNSVEVQRISLEGSQNPDVYTLTEQDCSQEEKRLSPEDSQNM